MDRSLTKSHLAQHSNPFFSMKCTSFDWSRADNLQKSPTTSPYRQVCYFIYDIQRRAALSRSLDGNCSTGRSRYRCACRACSCRLHTRATCERQNDANASSKEAVVHVEVDRRIDENSASNLECSPSFTEALLIKTEAPFIKIEAPSIKYSVLNLSQTSRPRTQKSLVIFARGNHVHM